MVGLIIRQRAFDLSEVVICTLNIGLWSVGERPVWLTLQAPQDRVGLGSLCRASKGWCGSSCFPYGPDGRELKGQGLFNLNLSSFLSFYISSFKFLPEAKGFLCALSLSLLVCSWFPVDFGGISVKDFSSTSDSDSSTEIFPPPPHHVDHQDCSDADPSKPLS
ncbi:hypothetical protein RIF29_19541 [Crotalaria pallida]|uniref:Uncharacterized protein n=1 Tax=Crotalaria pallida TaxID=3830 RepID=A0AAN9EZM6_CROPI